eukprot:scaffold19736_cov28-Tisochrysis_lutea.AAC.3
MAHRSVSKKSKALRSAVVEDLYSGEAQAQNSSKSIRPSALASRSLQIGVEIGTGLTGSGKETGSGGGGGAARAGRLT